MPNENLTIKAFKNKVYATFGGDFVRTVPMAGNDAPYVGYIKTTIGESKVAHDSETLHSVLSSGKEITKKEYDEAILIAVNRL
jgi:hypothetical protein